MLITPRLQRACSSSTVMIRKKLDTLESHFRDRHLGPPRHSRSVTTFLVQKCPLLDQYFQNISRIIHATLSESYNYEYKVTASGSDLYHIIHNPRIEFVSLLYVFGMYLCDKQQRSLPRNIRQHHATRKLAAADHAMVSLLYRMPYCSLFSGSHLGVNRRRQTAGNSIIFRLLLYLKPCARTVLHFQMLIWAGLLDFSASVTRAGSCAEQSRLRTSDYEYSTVGASAYCHGSTRRCPAY